MAKKKKKAKKADPRRKPKPGTRRAKTKSKKTVKSKAKSKKKTVKSKAKKKTVKKPKKVEPKPVGGQTKYDKKFDKIASDSIELGHTNKTTLTLIGISEATWYLWMKEQPTFKAAVNHARDELILDKIKKTNVRMCLGYMYTEVTSEPATAVIAEAIANNPKMGDKELETLLKTLGVDKDGFVRTKKVRKHKTPDAGLIKHYLHNKSGGEFQARQSVELEAGKSLVDIMAKVGILGDSN